MNGPTPLQAAKQRILSFFPRFSPMFLRLDIQVIPGRDAYVTEDLRVALGEDNLKSPAVAAGTIMHELCHPLFGHFSRRGTRDPKMWNAATDIAINEMLERMFADVGQSKFSTEPDWYFARTFGLTFGKVIPKAEEIYDLLMKDPQAREKVGRACGSGAGNPHPDEGQLAPRSDPKTFEQVQAAIDQTMNEIATKGGTHQTGRGSQPGWGSDEFTMWKGIKPRPSVTRWQDEVGAVIGLDIQSVLGRTYVEDWRTPGRRGMDFLPGEYTTIPELSVVVDTSGSTFGTGESVLGEIGGIITAFGPTRVLTVDTKVKSDTIVSNEDEFLAAAKGGGGTDMTPGLVAAGDGVIVCITDGELFGIPDFDRVDDVIWVITRRGETPKWMTKVVKAYGE